MAAWVAAGQRVAIFSSGSREAETKGQALTITALIERKLFVYEKPPVRRRGSSLSTRTKGISLPTSRPTLIRKLRRPAAETSGFSAMLNGRLSQAKWH